MLESYSKVTLVEGLKLSFFKYKFIWEKHSFEETKEVLLDTNTMYYTSIAIAF